MDPITPQETVPEFTGMSQNCQDLLQEAFPELLLMSQVFSFLMNSYIWCHFIKFFGFRLTHAEAYSMSVPSYFLPEIGMPVSVFNI
jgi:hypothetical protein